MLWEWCFNYSCNLRTCDNYGQCIKEKAKYVYPLLVSVLFIPSVFIYYNDSALIHSIWYLVISSVGLLIGALMQYFFSRK